VRPALGLGCSTARIPPPRALFFFSLRRFFLNVRTSRGSGASLLLDLAAFVEEGEDMKGAGFDKSSAFAT
jgi:hypothetical protein